MVLSHWSNCPGEVEGTHQMLQAHLHILFYVYKCLSMAIQRGNAASVIGTFALEPARGGVVD